MNAQERRRERRKTQQDEWKKENPTLVGVKASPDSSLVVNVDGADHLHPLDKAEIKNTAFEALTVGEIEAEELISELESSELGRAIRAKRFHEAISWMK